MKKLLILLTSIFSLLVSAPKVLGASEFTTSFHSLYTVPRSGPTQVVHTITLKNNLSHIYATDYSLSTSGDDLSGITASDETGPITSSTTTQNGVTTIHLKIDHPAIGKDQAKTLKLVYQTAEIVEKIGGTTTINIPRLSRANEAVEYTRLIRVEGVEELPALIYPPATHTQVSGNYTEYTFLAHQNSSLTLLFGRSVTYRLHLTYELKNKELTSGDSELALPPDTAYQQVLLASLSPAPTRIDLDDSGNWLARYPLRPQEKLLVKAELYVTVYPIPTLYDPSATALQKTPHSKYWDTTSSPVIDLAGRLKTPANIYEYLVSNFTYNYAGIAKGTRQGALAAITSPSLVLCTEFTDSFVALARLNNIPAREINGYGYTKNSTLQPQNTQTDILHSWPEYYDQTTKRWVQVDPTWGNTTGGIDYFNKLDFSHITFVRHGAEESYPLPAGAYKSDPQAKYIEVQVADIDLPEPRTEYEIRSEGSERFVYNLGNTALLDAAVSVDGRELRVPYLPPSGRYPVVLPASNSFWSTLSEFFAKLATWAHIR